MTAPESFNEVGRWFSVLERQVREGFERLEARLDEAVQRRELEALERRVEKAENHLAEADARAAVMAEQARTYTDQKVGSVSVTARWAIGIVGTLLLITVAVVALFV